MWYRFAKPVDVQINRETDELYAARKLREEVVGFFCHKHKCAVSVPPVSVIDYG